MSFTFGSPTTTASSTFGTSTQSSSFNFSTGDATSKPAFSFGGNVATTKPGGFSFATPGGAGAATPFNISATSPPSFAFGTPKTTASLLLGSSPATTTSSSQFQLSSGTGLFASTPPTGLNFGSPTQATAAQPTLGPAPATSPPQFGFGSVATTAAQSLPAFGSPALTTAQVPNTGFSFGSSPGGLSAFGVTPIKPAATQASTATTYGSALPAFGSPLPALTTPVPLLGQNVVSTASTTGMFGTTTPSLFGQSPTSFTLPKPVTSSAILQPQPLASDHATLFGNVNAKLTLPAAATTAPTLPAFGLQTSQLPKQQSVSFAPVSAAAAPSPILSAGIQLGTTASTIPSTALQFGTTAATTSATPLQLGAAHTPLIASATTAAPSVKFQLGVSTSAPSTGFQLGSTASTLASGIQLGAPTSALSVGLQLGSVAPKTTVPTVQSTVASTPTSGLGVIATPITSSISMPTATIGGLAGAFQPPPASGAATTIGTSLTTSTITTAATPQPPSEISSMSFAQLEEMINKWTLDLEEQEKIFINQATQVNAWDRLLIANGEKIVQLNDAIQSVQAEQNNLDYELDFVLAQQKELEELLVPLEKELTNVTVADPEREQIYNMAENVDTQLKSMSEDLKEVIDHLNESSRSQDSNDPIVQIGRILNAHMSSLQWIDSSTAQISSKLDQLTAMRNALRRDNERTFHLTYN